MDPATGGGDDGQEVDDGVDVQIVHVPGRSRFEAHSCGRHAATLEYRISGAAAVLTDTRATVGGQDTSFSALIDAALDALVRSGHYAVALCPHVRAFLRARPDRRAGVDARFVDPAPSGAMSVAGGYAGRPRG